MALVLFINTLFLQKTNNGYTDRTKGAGLYIV